MEFDFSEEVLRRALLNIYSRDFHPATEITGPLSLDVIDSCIENIEAVSYTHLDVYKRQPYMWTVAR